MKANRVIKYIVLPAAALAAGVKLGIKYTENHYVSKDRKFIEAEIAKREKNARS